MSPIPSPISIHPFFELLDALKAPADAEALFVPDSPPGLLRRGNLERYLELMTDIRPAVLLVGEAPGWRGATVTGVPFMSVREISVRPGLITGDADGDGFAVPADPSALWEASSSAVWSALADWSGPLPMSWPIYPHHPFLRAAAPDGARAPERASLLRRAAAPDPAGAGASGDDIADAERRTNRTPRLAEVRAGTPIALELARAFEIRTVVAVGRKAQGALASVGVDAPAIRHPAQGGAKLFAAQLAALNAAAR
jgi:hypothetical protein